MPRYFFHVMDGRAVVDSEGTELAGLDEARTEALRTAGAILREAGADEFRNAEWLLTVADEDTHTVFSLRFSANYHGR